MEIKQTALAGTLESSDIQIMLSQGEKGIHFDLTSDVKKQFGEDIMATIQSVLQAYDIENVLVKVVDKGALTPVIKARAIAVAQRALDLKDEPNWEVL
ncbi:citrate lyase acyl carrier protein [Fructobacillus parabroussonetiae]|uniref:Citrate lyase acyl carrier protein n=1 Tax=Fructobacillus parabroussonetiae TaxID=2713174 RepID=A0ABS5QWQ8_9LACO|nr:citrate lyase acyl carrier protein [Fructobacillus parabroussonetiae]MBS9337556.1 citrate lyase acyl carrier protein [Fructobacillus parabroussonetiae]MCK8617193.1 citrate lyase acyl carrier protein [Fructobacillus parabroussonetiae]